MKTFLRGLLPVLAFVFLFCSCENVLDVDLAAIFQALPAVSDGSVHPETLPGSSEPSTVDTAAVLSGVPPFSGSPYAEVNGNVPFFNSADISETSFEHYSALDIFGRCCTAFANIGPELMPEEERGPIGDIKPSGWHTVRYDFIDGHYLYNRCHLIGYQLTGENANVRNLITGTRYLNISGMLPFENRTADFIRRTGMHVLYRVTPIFDGYDLLASGVLIEALSVEDGGSGLCFNVYCYNVQPGVDIDYATGDNSLSTSR